MWDAVEVSLRGGCCIITRPNEGRRRRAESEELVVGFGFWLGAFLVVVFGFGIAERGSHGRTNSCRVTLAASNSVFLTGGKREITAFRPCTNQRPVGHS